MPKKGKWARPNTSWTPYNPFGSRDSLKSGFWNPSLSKTMFSGVPKPRFPERGPASGKPILRNRSNFGSRPRGPGLAPGIGALLLGFGALLLGFGALLLGFGALLLTFGARS